VPTTRTLIVDDAPRQAWSEFVAGHPAGSVFHTPEMHDVFARARRCSPLSLAAVDGDGRLAALLSAVQVHTLPPVLGAFASRSVLYAEPLCRPGAAPALAALVREHDRRMQRRVVFAEVRPLGPEGEERGALEEAGYEHYPYLNFIVDLRRPEEEIWSGFTQSARRAVRRSADAGVTVEDANDPAGLDALYRLCQAVYRRSRIPLAHRSLFEAALAVMVPRGMGRIFVARKDGQVVGAHMMLMQGDHVVAWYWASVRTRGLFVLEHLIWHSLRWSARQGYATFDMGGAGRPDETYGVRDFKRKFGGEQVCFGRYRRVYSPRRMSAAEGAYDLVRSRMARAAGLVFGWRGTGGEPPR
jgi:serine/alanine adding enzyme